MRELLFEIDTAPGWDPVAEALTEHPATSIRSLSCHATQDRLWRVDHVTGPQSALEAIERAYGTAEYYPDCLVAGDCDARSRIEVIDRDESALVVSSRWERTPSCASVPHLALEQLGEGVLFETHRTERRHRWRLILPDDRPIGPFSSALREAIDDIGGVTLLRLSDHTPTAAVTDPELPPEQRRAVHAAVAHGYYEVPRRIDLGDLAATLDVPRSTLSYRLRRAEATLASGFVRRDSSLETVQAVE